MVALAAGAVASLRVAPLGPLLEISVIRAFPRGDQNVFDLRISSRGGEVIEEVRIEPLRGALRVAPPGFTRDLVPGVRYRARVNVSTATEVPAAVRVLQKGRVDRTYDIELAESVE